MFEFSNGFAGAVTIACLVGLGTFLYPWLLRRRGGGLIVGVMTVLLTLAYTVFDRGNGVALTTSVLLAFLWAIAPVVAGVIVYRLQRGRPSA